MAAFARVLTWVILVVAGLTFAFGTLVGTAGLDVAAWTRILGFGVLMLLLVEAEKTLIKNLNLGRKAGNTRTAQ